MNYDSASSPSPSAASGDQPVHGADATRTSSPSLGASPPPAADGPAAEDSCAWCGRGPSSGERDFDVDETWPSAAAEDDEDGRRRPTTTGGGGGRRYDQLRFCSRSCVGRYKMDLFCRETQRYLHQLQASAFTARNTIIVSLMGLLQLRYEHDSSTIRLQHATTRYEVFRSLAYEIVYENQW